MPVKLKRISFGLAFIALAVACSKKPDGPVIATTPGDVEIDLNCGASDGVFSATISPWQVQMPSRTHGRGIKWKLKSSKGGVVSADVDSAQGKPWPFTPKKFKANAGGSTDGDGNDLKSGVAGGTYPYTITTTCTIGGTTRTIVIDPDMIIPN